MNKELKWACSYLLEASNIPAGPNYLQAFENASANQQWIYSLIRKAAPQIGSMNSSYYDRAIQILRANGISTDPYGPGSG
jgi:hypothetical protein